MNLLMTTTKTQRSVYALQALLWMWLFLSIASPWSLSLMLHAYNDAFIKWVSWAFAIAYIPEITWLWIAVFRWLWGVKFQVQKQEMKKQAKSWKLIDWVISAEDLANFLIEYWWFPVKKLQEFFDINNEEYKKLWDNMHRMWVLKRWSANARVLATYDAEYIAHILMSSLDSDHFHYSKDWEKMYIAPDYIKEKQLA